MMSDQYPLYPPDAMNTKSHGFESPQSREVTSRPFPDDSSRENNGQRSIRTGKPRFVYARKLFILLLPSLAVILSFGGKLSMLALAYGSVGAYMFDLLGSLEGTLLSIIMTLFAVWVTLIWAARLLLYESLINFSLLVIMGQVLFALFVLICGNFDSIVQEFPAVLMSCESFLFASIPVYSAVILTWFICVEIPDVDTSICFTIVYYIFLMQLGPPHRSYLKTAKSSSNNLQEMNVYTKIDDKDYVLSSQLILFLDIFPIFFTGIMSVCSHHMVMFSSMYHLFSPLVPSLLSFLLMSICLSSQRKYFTEGSLLSLDADGDGSSVFQSFMEGLKFLCGALLIVFFQNNPAFDDIKLLVYHRKSIVSFGICTLAFLGALTLFLVRLRKKKNDEINSDYFSGKDGKRPWKFVLFDTSLLIAAGVCAWLMAFILNLSMVISVSTAMAGMCLCQFYISRPGAYGSIAEMLKPIVLVGFAAVVTGLNFLGFFNQTLSSLVLELTWVQDISIQHLCYLCSALGGAAIVLPAIGHITLYDSRNKGGILPGENVGSPYGSKSSAPSRGYSLPPRTFEVLFQFLAMVITALELLIREQNWKGDLGVNVEAVYPAYLLLSTGLLFGYTAYHCWTLDLMRLSAVWLTWLSQSVKLLHLLGLPSLAAGAVGALVYAQLSPFISLYRPDTLSDSSDPIPSATTYLVSSVVMMWQVFQAGLSVFWFYRHIARKVFVMVLSRAPTEMQVIAGCIAIFSTFLSAYSFVYIPEMTGLRGITMMMSALSVFIASGAVPGINVSLDWDSPLIINIAVGSGDSALSNFESFSLRSDGTSSGICLILSTFLIITASLNIFPINKLPYRLLFLVLFSITSTEAILGWAYPINLSNDSPQHSILQFPFLHTLILSVIITSTALHATLPKASDVGEKIFLVGILWIIGGVGWCFVSDEPLLYDGVLWAAMAASAGLAIVTSISHTMRHINLPKKPASSIPKEFSSTATTVCGLASVLMIFSAFALSLVGHHHVEMDFLVPISSIILLTTRKDLFLTDVYPIELAVVISVAWWFFRMIYLMFVDGYGSDRPVGFQESFGMFHTTSISYWVSPLPTWLVLANLAMGLAALPAVIFSIMRRKSESEEMMLFFAIMGLLPLIGSQANCIRFMGGFATVYGCWRCYDLGQQSSASNRMI